MNFDRLYIEINHSGENVPKGRPRFRRMGSRVFSYTDARTKTAETILKMLFKSKCRVPLVVPCGLEIIFFKKRPKTTKFKDFPGVRFDLDNASKLLMDAGNGILWADDALICSLNCSKVWSDVGDGFRLRLFH